MSVFGNVASGRAAGVEVFARAWSMKKSTVVIILILLWLPGCSAAGVREGLHLDKVEMPAGFRISLYARVPGARSMVLSPGGSLFVGTRKEGTVYAVLDHDRDQVADEVIAVARGLHMPNGVAFRKGALYVAEVSRVLRYEGIEETLRNPPDPVVINGSLPTDEHHGWKYIAFGPDDRLYVPVGAPCNVCEREDPRYATIMRMDPDGQGLEIYASGIRNTVGFDWHPDTRVLWFTDNGRDWMGDDLPPDELNQAPTAGMHFGFPYCHAGRLRDFVYGAEKPCSLFSPPAMDLGPHVAALGMKFYTGRMFPNQYRNQIFIAEHGSWNRRDPIGYRIMLVRLKGDRALEYTVFARGWLQKDRAWGRPVDVLVMPDGALLVSDDRAGAVYRIYYES